MLWFVSKESSVGGNFSLTYRGQNWLFSEQPKQLNLLYIGYAKCPDVCPMTLSVVGHAFRELSNEEKQKVRQLFVSVDRDNDDPNDVAQYASQFYPDFLGLSGSREQIDQLVSQFHARYVVEKNPNSYLGYSIAHSDNLFFLDKNGLVKTTITSPRSPELVLKTIKENL
ncbi:MAG: SCO family protein [Oligoflexia bacterium]|nr:SCO family protein [Oligoflexia bacterium]